MSLCLSQRTLSNANIRFVGYQVGHLAMRLQSPAEPMALQTQTNGNRWQDRAPSGACTMAPTAKLAPSVSLSVCSARRFALRCFTHFSIFTFNVTLPIILSKLEGNRTTGDSATAADVPKSASLLSDNELEFLS